MWHRPARSDWIFPDGWRNCLVFDGYLLVNIQKGQKAIEHGPVEIVDFPLQNSDPTGFVVEWRLSDVRHFWCPAILTSDLAMRLVGSSACFDHVGPAQTATYGFVWNGPSPIPMDDHHLHDFFPHILLPCGAKKKGLGHFQKTQPYLTYV
jgi:hypothetical protein